MDEMTTTPAPSTVVRAPSGRRLRRLAVITVAATLPLLVWLVAVPVAGIELVAGSGAAAQLVGPASIAVAALVGGFAAWGALALIERVGRTSGRVFAIIGWFVLAISLLGPVLVGTTGSALVVLIAMHIVTGATLVIGLPLAARAPARAPGAGDVDWRGTVTGAGAPRRG
jgi:hypothetical protein